MSKQFFFTRKEPIQGTEPLEFKSYTDSFNVDKVIRTIVMENDHRLVLLDDIHERLTDVPQINSKTGTMKGTKRERGTYQSEIYLSPEDSEKFIKTMYYKA